MEDVEWRLATPQNVKFNLDLKAIKPVVTSSARQGHLWEQVQLAKSPGVLVNLGNSGPVLHGNSITVIHDAAVFATPENFSRKYATAHRMLGRMLSRTSQIGTVSNFSRHELSRALNLSADRIFVAPNGANHLLNALADTAVIARLGLTRGKYLLFVGSPTRNKNLPLALEAFAAIDRPDSKLVLVGALNSSVFRTGAIEETGSIVVAGRLSDAEITALYRDAAALVFPSLYEGFGIPPLEAMINGCPVLAADTKVARETCGDAALYFALGDAEGLRGLMRDRLDHPETRDGLAAAGRAQAGRWTWLNSALSLASAVRERLAA
jgi:glycosyltransferase involved in cell wall biosynthesis